MSIYTKILDFVLNNVWKVTFLITSIFSLIALISAFIIDYILKFDPCFLCVYARIPYLIMFMLGAIGLYFQDYRKIIINLIILAVMVGAGIAIYHTGVERSWWDPSYSCTPHIILGEKTSLDDFMKQLDSAPLGDCSRPAFKILGFSLAEINIMINLVLFAIYMKINRTYD